MIQRSEIKHHFIENGEYILTNHMHPIANNKLLHGIVADWHVILFVNYRSGVALGLVTRHVE